MLSAADIEAWDDDVRTEATAALRASGWVAAPPRRAPTAHLRRLLERLHAGRSLTTRELADLRQGLGV